MPNKQKKQKPEQFSTKKPGTDNRTMQQKLVDAQELPPVPRAVVKLILLNTETGIEEWSVAVGADTFDDFTKPLPEEFQEPEIKNERDRVWKHAKNVEAGISGGFLDEHGVKKEESDEPASTEN